MSLHREMALTLSRIEDEQQITQQMVQRLATQQGLLGASADNEKSVRALAPSSRVPSNLGSAHGEAPVDEYSKQSDWGAVR